MGRSPTASTSFLINQADSAPMNTTPMKTTTKPAA
jgi:hypothetical protein